MAISPGVLFAAALLSALSLTAGPFTLPAGSNPAVSFSGHYDAVRITVPGDGFTPQLSNFTIGASFLAGQSATVSTIDYFIRNSSVGSNLTTSISSFSLNAAPNLLTASSSSVANLFDTVLSTADGCWTGQDCPTSNDGGAIIIAIASDFTTN
jgi:hypothetical protein